MSSLYVNLIQCEELFSNHLEANFNHLLGTELTTEVIFLVLSSLDDDLFATDVGCEIKYIDTTELTNIPYISARATCTINFFVKKSWMLGLNIWMLRFLEASKY